MPGMLFEFELQLSPQLESYEHRHFYPTRHWQDCSTPYQYGASPWSCLIFRWLSAPMSQKLWGYLVLKREFMSQKYWKCSEED